MKAILIDKDTNALSWSNVPNPVVGPEDALVEIHAAALNRADLMQRAGDYPPPLPRMDGPRDRGRDR